jgi:hypothetical protein
MKMNLKRINEIHNEASRRIDLPGYQKFRGVLEKITNQLEIGEWDETAREKNITQIIRRMSHQIAMLVAENESL